MTQQDDITQRVLTTEQRNEFIRRTSFISESDRDTRAAFVDEIARAIESALLSKLRAPVADERAGIVEATAHVTEALLYVDRVAQRKAIGYADVGTNPRRHYNDTRPYNLKDARHDAYTAAILLRKAWDILDPSISFKPATALASAPVAAETLDEIKPPVPLDGHSMGPLTPVYDHVGSLIGQVLATARHGAYEGSIVWARMRRAGDWMPWCVVGRQSAPVAGEAIGYSTGIHWRPRQSEQTIKLTRTAQPEYGFVHALYAAPQASAEDVRNAALEEAASVLEGISNGHKGGSDFSRAYAGAATCIRALKQPQADKDGGQQRAGDGKTREAVDYPRGGALNFDGPAPADAEGIRSQFNACMHRDECRAMLDRQPKLPGGWQLALNLAIDAIENAAPMDWPVNWPAILHGLKELRAALSAPQAEQGERDA